MTRQRGQVEAFQIQRRQFLQRQALQAGEIDPVYVTQ